MANIMISVTAILVIFLCLSAAAASRSLVGLDGMSVAVNDGICKSMVVSQGYNCHEHTVTTKDGYILSMQHIPSGRSGKKADKPPVLLQHGLLMDACTWVLNSPQESLAFILADNGFDVWLANTRGTKYSRGHTSLTPNDPAYWYWSWDELAAYDLSASVQFVYNQTAEQKLHYVGHSLGTLIALAAFSQDQTVNMLRSAALLSPIAHLGQMPSLLARAAAEAFIGEALYWLGIREFAPGGEAVAKLMQDICNTPGANCSDLMSSFTGQNCCVNSSMTNNFLKHEPQSTATKNMIHLAQMIRKGTVAMYDYGNTDQNMEQYGQPNPPLYDMTSIPNDFPLYFGYGGKDMLADVKDVHVLLDSLKSHESDKMVVQFQADYAHADFVFGVNANQVVYNPLMAFFKLN